MTYAPPFDTYNLTYTPANNALTNYFHNYGAIPDYNTDQHVELGELSSLDDFRTEAAYVRSNMAQIYQYWVGQAGFDGFRIDTVKHVEMGFWQYWAPLLHSYAAGLGKTNFFMFGEVYDGSDSKCGSYTGMQSGGPFELDSVLDYPLYFLVNSVFATASGDTQQIENRYDDITGNYDPVSQMQLVTFLDNHDQPRFMSASGATTDRLNVALAFLYTSRGVPSLYYGTEQAFNGTTDPNDREDMFDGQFEQGALAGRRQFQHDPSAVPDGCQAEQFPAPLSGAANWRARQQVEQSKRPRSFRLCPAARDGGSVCGFQHLDLDTNPHQPLDQFSRRNKNPEPLRYQRGADSHLHSRDSADHRAWHDG